MRRRDPASARPLRRNLSLGAESVQLLLPHRRPFLMVDRVLALRAAPAPALLARRAISVNEPVFAGHFPDLALWPGVYTIEGLAQSALILLRLLGIAGAWCDGEGRDLAALCQALNAADGQLRRTPGALPPQAQALADAAPGGAALLAAVDVKLIAPVYAGDSLEYRVDGPADLTIDQASVRLAVEARVERRTVASGQLTVTRVG